MKITKMVEQFNPEAFEVGKLYYLSLANDHDDGSRDILGKGIYLCTKLYRSSADFKLILSFAGLGYEKPVCSIINGKYSANTPSDDWVHIGQDNLEAVKQAEEVIPQIEYDYGYKGKWNVVMSIEEDET